jgi:hypothetical protein
MKCEEGLSLKIIFPCVFFMGVWTVIFPTSMKCERKERNIVLCEDSILLQIFVFTTKKIML